MRRPIQGRIKQITITRKNSKWYAIFAIEQVYPIFKLVPITLNKIVALDLNSTNDKFIVASNKDDKKFNIGNNGLARRQTNIKLSRRKEGSSNYKARNRLR